MPNEPLTIEQIKEKKRIAEADILDLTRRYQSEIDSLTLSLQSETKEIINDFQQETGLKVDGYDVTSKETRNNPHFVAGITLNIKL